MIVHVDKMMQQEKSWAKTTKVVKKRYALKVVHNTESSSPFTQLNTTKFVSVSTLSMTSAIYRA